MTRPIRAVVVLLVANLVLSVAFALLTLTFHGSVLAYQQAAHPGADPHALAITLWTRPVPVLVVAVLYVWVIRRLRAGAAAAYRRVRIVSVVGFPAVAWLLVSAEYPGWLRAVQVVQLVVLGALVVAANLPSVRAAFPAAPDPRPRNRKAAWLLVLAAPLVAEVGLGNIPLDMPWVLLFFMPVYGGGALFVREVVRRTGGGIGSLLLLGVAYGLVEEGLALQSLTSPHLYGAAGWAPRLFGLNTAYTELNLVYHAVFSITIPVLLVEARYGTRPYLRRGGVIAAGVVALLGAGILRVSVPPTEDPGYTMSPAAALIITAAVAAIAVIALRTGRRRQEGPTEQRRPTEQPDGATGHDAAGPVPGRVGVTPTPPSVPIVAVVTALAAFAFLALIWPWGGAKQPLFTHGAWALLPMAGAAALAAATLWTVRRWAITPRHLLAACVGALVGHTAFGLLGNGATTADRIFLLIVAALTVGAGAVALRKRPARVDT